MRLRALQAPKSPRELQHLFQLVTGSRSISVQVSNVAALIKSLGGYELYGQNHYIPLRELLQNASDAVRARRYLVEAYAGYKEDYRGRVVIDVEEEETATKLTIRDNGIGMSLGTLTSELLDFGSSLWRSNRLAEEFPEILRTPFAATGRYGIGFFSVFMWATKVRVTTRKCNEQDRTYILEFEGGAVRRP